MTRTPAPELSPAEAARVAAFDAAQAPPECDPERVEAVVDALYDLRWPDGESLLRMARTHVRRLAAAAIAADPSPAEEAVKRVEAELDRQARLGHVNQYGATQLRAALASPAPATQECESRGPRIGSDGKPICRLLLGHAGLHAPSADDGWGNVTWGDPR